jgi:hypothetical protein
MRSTEDQWLAFVVNPSDLSDEDGGRTPVTWAAVETNMRSARALPGWVVSGYEDCVMLFNIQPGGKGLGYGLGYFWVYLRMR